MEIIEQSKNSISHVKKNKRKFLVSKDPGAELASQIQFDALFLGATIVKVGRFDRHWWIIKSDFDWLVSESLSPKDLFFNLVAFPMAGQNFTRSEVVATAFSDYVVSLTNDNRELIKSANLDVPELISNLSCSGDWKRIIAYHLIHDCVNKK